MVLKIILFIESFIFTLIKICLILLKLTFFTKFKIFTLKKIILKSCKNSKFSYYIIDSNFLLKY